MFFQALLVFSRDTSVLKHFDQSSATPPKSYIRGEQKQFFLILIQHVTRFQLSSLHYICVGEFCLFALSALSEFSMGTTVVSPPNLSQYFIWCKLSLIGIIVSINLPRFLQLPLIVLVKTHFFM